MVLEVVLVELDAEARAGPELVPTIVDPARHVGQVPEERVAFFVEAFHERVVRDAREKMGRDLGLLVMTELDAERGGTPAAFRQIVGPPAQDASKFDTSIAPSTIRSRIPRRVVSLCPAHTASPVW